MKWLLEVSQPGEIIKFEDEIKVDQLVIDTRWDPEPATLALMLLAMPILIRRRRRG